MRRTSYWIATSRFDLTAEQIALILQVALANRNVLCLVEAAPQGITSFHEAAMVS